MYFQDLDNSDSQDLFKDQGSFKNLSFLWNSGMQSLNFQPQDKTESQVPKPYRNPCRTPLGPFTVRNPKNRKGSRVVEFV